MADYFVNPYTFVSLREGKTLNTISPKDKMLTGKLVCTIHTKTPLAIPDLKNGITPEGINKHPFFRVDGKAVIPGSSIRGVIRNVYEALTNSCMHINDKEDDFFSSRQNKLHAGLIVLKNGEYVLYKAERLRAMQFDSTLKTGEKVSFRKQIKDETDQSLYDMAYSVNRDSCGKGIFLKVDLFRSMRKDKKTGQECLPRTTRAYLSWVTWKISLQKMKSVHLRKILIDTIRKLPKTLQVITPPASRL